MAQTYTYSISGDFPNGKVAADSLTEEINASSISTGVLQFIDVAVSAPDNCDITFDVALSAGDKTTLDGIVAAHLGIPVLVASIESPQWKWSVIDRDFTAPPGSPADGDLYIIGPSATGAWAGFDNFVARYVAADSGWAFESPTDGLAAWVEDELTIVVYNLTQEEWQPLVASSTFSQVVSPTVNDDSTAGYAVGSTWIDTVADEVWICVDDSVGAAVWKNTGGGFGSDYQYVESLGSSSTTSSNYQTKLSLTTPALTGTYLVTWGGVASNDGDRGFWRLYNDTDAVELSVNQWKFGNADDVKATVGGFAQVVFTGSAKTFRIQWRDWNGGHTTSIEQARLMLWKASS